MKSKLKDGINEHHLAPNLAMELGREIGSIAKNLNKKR